MRELVAQATWATYQARLAMYHHVSICWLDLEKLEARAFRLLATLRRLSAQLDCAKCYHKVDPNHSGWKANFD